jgi:hypothetical protein
LSESAVRLRRQPEFVLVRLTYRLQVLVRLTYRLQVLVRLTYRRSV